MCMEGSAVLQHTVSDAQFCQDIFGLGGVFLQLAADVGHVDPQDLVVAALVGAPDMLEDEVIGEYLAGMETEQLQDLELVLCEVDLLAAHEDLVAGSVHD